MASKTNYWQKQEGFEPSAFREACLETVAKWAKDLNYTKVYDKRRHLQDPDCSAYCEYVGNHGFGRMGINDLKTDLHIKVPYELLDDFTWGCLSYSLFADEDGTALIYFRGFETKGGDTGIKKMLFYRKQIEKRAKELEETL